MSIGKPILSNDKRYIHVETEVYYANRLLVETNKVDYYLQKVSASIKLGDANYVITDERCDTLIIKDVIYKNSTPINRYNILLVYIHDRIEHSNMSE